MTPYFIIKKVIAIRRFIVDDARRFSDFQRASVGLHAVEPTCFFTQQRIIE